MRDEELPFAANRMNDLNTEKRDDQRDESSCQWWGHVEGTWRGR